MRGARVERGGSDRASDSPRSFRAESRAGPGRGPSPRPRPVVRVPGRGPESSALPSVTCARLLCRCDICRVQAVYQSGWGSAAVAAAGPGPKPRCFGAAGAMRLRPRIPSSVAALLRLCRGLVAAEDSDSHAALAQAVQGRPGPWQIPLSSQHEHPPSPPSLPLPRPTNLPNCAEAMDEVARQQQQQDGKAKNKTKRQDDDKAKTQSKQQAKQRKKAKK